MSVLTTGEIAKYCNVTHRCVLQWICEGKIKTYKTPGKHNRVNEKDFISFLKTYNMPIPDAIRNVNVKRKLLIIEDEKAEVNALKRLLSKDSSYEITIAYNGFEAAQKLYDSKPDLVIVDIRMPGMDGYEVIRYIKDISGAEEIRIIAVSGYFTSEGKKRCLETGADICFDKPYENKELLKTIKQLF